MHTIHTVGLNQDSEDKQLEELKYTVKVINVGTHHCRFSDVSDIQKTSLHQILPHYWKIVPISCLGTFSVAMVWWANNFPLQKMTFKACMTIFMWMKICTQIKVIDVGSWKWKISVYNAEGGSSIKNERRRGNKDLENRHGESKVYSTAWLTFFPQFKAFEG